MSERKPSQECPICGAMQPLSARTCSICGATLPGELTPAVPLVAVVPETKSEKRPRYDPAEGDDDLYMGDLVGRTRRWMIAGGVLLALLIGLAAGIGISRLTGGSDPEVKVQGILPTAPPTATPRGTRPAPTATVTQRPLVKLSTVTPAPPTPTDSPTPGPCLQTAVQDDTVYGMAIRCGHQDMAVVDMILEMNDMDSAQELQLGQTLEIPWPTPSEPTEAAPPPTNSEGDTTNTSMEITTDIPLNEFGTPDIMAAYQNIEPTLRPGLAWHTVEAGQTMLDLVYLYETNVQTLQQLNPEITFSGCDDYSSITGGENCSVILMQGQQVRVPVPLPTQTPTFTPEGTLTPTPTATATFNAPYLLMPEDGKRFFADERITLRWGGTGTLAENERYVVRVTDADLDQAYIALVKDMMYELPGGWQPSDGSQHTFTWTVSIATVDPNLNILSENYTTQPQTFTWDSR